MKLRFAVVLLLVVLSVLALNLTVVAQPNAPVEAGAPTCPGCCARRPR